MADIPAELGALPLEHIIGAPLVAAIKAQALAAQTTVDFIKEVGLKPRQLAEGESNDHLDETSGEAGQEGLEARYVEFKFDRVLEERVELTEAVPGTPATETEPEVPPIPATYGSKYSVVPSKLTTPLLAIVPMPYIRINDMTIDFEFQIKDVETYESTAQGSVSTSARGGLWFAKASVKGSYSNRTVNKRETDRRTTLKITVNALQDQIPEGLGRVLDILYEATKVVPLPVPAEEE